MLSMAPHMAPMHPCFLLSLAGEVEEGGGGGGGWGGAHMMVIRTAMSSLRLILEFMA